MFTGSTTSAMPDKEPAPEVTDKTILDKAGECLWWVINYFQHEHHKMENRRHPPDRGPDPDFNSGLQDLENLRKVIKEELRGHESHVNWGIQGPSEPEDTKRNGVVDVLLKTIASITVLAIVAAVSFLYGRVWDHETRISHLEGREAPSARSP